MTYDGFNVVHQVIECDESQLALEMGILRQMATRMAISTMRRYHDAISI
jgi:hypothetical protein